MLANCWREMIGDNRKMALLSQNYIVSHLPELYLPLRCTAFPNGSQYNTWFNRSLGIFQSKLDHANFVKPPL